MGSRAPVTHAWRYALAVGLTLGALAALWAAPGRALASPTQTSILMDDDQLIYASPAHVKSVMEQIAALGINTVKVSMVWSLVAPKASSTHKPSFNATDPNAYPPGAWTRYDTIVMLAQQLNLGVYFQLTAPAPAWAVVGGRIPAGGHSWSHEPNAKEFGQFAEAVGRRYSGTFVPPGAAKSGSPVSLPPLPSTLFNLNNPLSSGTAPATPNALPRVRWWGLWNEPNEIGWLSPQTRTVDHRTVLYSPMLDRQLADAAYNGLVAGGHKGDTILVGETASGGQTQPLPFVRAFYCVGATYRPLRGSAAAALGCPTSGRPSTFVAQNPALFQSGFAHHPYSFDQPPNVPFKTNPGIITLANLGRLGRALDYAFRSYGQPTGFPLYLTEWGYKTNPPNPFVHTTLTQQALWLNEGEYMTWRDPRVRALAQFLLVDDGPRQGATPGTLSYWSTFQTGLYYTNGRAKPSMAAFRIPIWVPVARTGRSVTVWGELRPAAHAGDQAAVLEFRATAAANWIDLRNVQTANPEGYIVAHVDIASPGQIRLGWYNAATDNVDYSRTVNIS